MNNIYKDTVYPHVELDNIEKALDNKDVVLAADPDLLEIDFLIVAMLKNGLALRYVSDSWVQNDDVVAAAYAGASKQEKDQVVELCKGYYTKDRLQALAEEKYPQTLIKREEGSTAKEDKKVGLLQKVISVISNIRSMLFSRFEKNTRGAIEKVNNPLSDPLRSSAMSSDNSNGKEESNTIDNNTEDRSATPDLKL